MAQSPHRRPSTTPTPSLVGRRHALVTFLRLGSLVALATLHGCGFELRRGYAMGFRSVQLSGFSAASPIGEDLGNALRASGVKVLDSALQAAQAASSAGLPSSHIEIVALRDKQDVVVSSRTAYAQVRIITARTALRFEIRRADGSLIVGPTDLSLTRDISYDEMYALAKQEEAIAVNRALARDIVDQLMRRLASIQAAQLEPPPLPTGLPASSPVNATSYFGASAPMEPAAKPGLPPPP